VQIGDNRAAEWVRRSNPVALGLLFSGLAGQQMVSFATNPRINAQHKNLISSPALTLFCREQYLS
jgi:hypothetical protein